jgi:aminoglycoside 6'-N-acetyltransferase I
MLSIRKAKPSDRGEWLRLRTALWPDSSADHAHEIDEYLRPESEERVALVAERPDAAGLCGFLEARLRSHADGCASSPVAYIEAWYVEPAHQKRGIGQALVDAAAEWARGLGLREMASDSELGNAVGRRAHLAAGFHEVGRVVQFRKELENEP